MPSTQSMRDDRWKGQFSGQPNEATPFSIDAEVARKCLCWECTRGIGSCVCIAPGFLQSRHWLYSVHYD
eukprot:6078318-Amphidinium_carterae.1